MTKHDIITRPGMTAIAAFAALSATPLLAQAADPLAPASEAAPTVTSSPPVVSVSEPTAAPVADPLAPETTATSSAATTAATPVARSSRATTRSTVRTVARPSTPVARTAAPVAAIPAAVAPPVSSAPVMVPEPVVAETAIAAPPVAPAPVEAGLPDEALPIAGAGLGALILAAAAMALRRRRRVTAAEETRYDEPAFATPVASTPISARGETPIMAWDKPAALTAPVGDGEVPAGINPSSHAAAAYRGPSADNPSLSLKKRLKRAAFFDQREKLAAAGMATPIASDAGLPDAMDVPVAPRADPVAKTAAPKAARPLTSGGAFSVTPSFHPA